MTKVEIRSCRPIKHVAVTLSIIALILIIIALSVGNWVEVALRNTDSYSAWGLWDECTVLDGVTVCVSKDWISACGAMMVLTLLGCIGAIVTGLIGLFTKKRLWYLIAGVCCLIAVICDFLALIIYPVKFNEDIHASRSARSWDFDWTYGMACGAVFFLIGAVVLFFIKSNEMEVIERPPHQFYDNRMT